jgi:hypothetical protein
MFIFKLLSFLPGFASGFMEWLNKKTDADLEKFKTAVGGDVTLNVAELRYKVEVARMAAQMRSLCPALSKFLCLEAIRKAQAKGIRYAHGLHASYFKESVLIRSAAEAKIREADRLECEAWNAIMWAGGPAMPSPGDVQAEPTIGKAINGGSICWRPSATAATACRWFPCAH